MNSNLLHNLSKTLILHPIAGLLSFLAFVCGLVGVACASRLATILMAVLSFLGALVGLVIFVIDMVLWNVLKNRVLEAGYHAALGNANWFTVAGVFAMILAMCASFFGACGRFATGRAAGEKVSHSRGPPQPPQDLEAARPHVRDLLTAVLIASLTRSTLQAAYNCHVWAMFTRRWPRESRGRSVSIARPSHICMIYRVLRCWQRVRWRVHALDGVCMVCDGVCMLCDECGGGEARLGGVQVQL